MGTKGTLLAGAVLAFYAYFDFGNIVPMTEETPNPNKTMPPAMLSAFALLSVMVGAAALCVALMVMPLAWTRHRL